VGEYHDGRISFCVWRPSRCLRSAVFPLGARREAGGEAAAAGAKLGCVYGGNPWLRLAGGGPAEGADWRGGVGIGEEGEHAAAGIASVADYGVLARGYDCGDISRTDDLQEAGESQQRCD
jgi:hypothetical protein